MQASQRLGKGTSDLVRDTVSGIIREGLGWVLTREGGESKKASCQAAEETLD
jgi:hypothetical protein